MTNFLRFHGVITKIERRGNDYFVTVQDANQSIMNLVIQRKTLIFDSCTTERIRRNALLVGDMIDAYYDKRKPMILIYPPQTTPEVVILHNPKCFGEVKVDQFNQNGLSSDHSLKINIGENTVLLNEQGRHIREKDLRGKELVVFYTFTTRSIPPQTTPTKIVALHDSFRE